MCYSVGTVDLTSVLWEINVCGIEKSTGHVDVQLFFLICELRTANNAKFCMILHFLKFAVLLKLALHFSCPGMQLPTFIFKACCSEIVTDSSILLIMFNVCLAKEKAPNYTLWRTYFGRGCEPVVRWTVE